MNIWPKKIGESQTSWRLENFNQAAALKEEHPEAVFVLGIQNCYGTNAVFYLARTLDELTQIILNAHETLPNPIFKCIDIHSSVVAQYYTSNATHPQIDGILAQGNNREVPIELTIKAEIPLTA